MNTLQANGFGIGTTGRHHDPSTGMPGTSSGGGLTPAASGGAAGIVGTGRGAARVG